MEQTPHSIGFLVIPDFSNLGLALAVEPLFVANWLAQKTLFKWSVLSADGLSVRASNGMHVPVDGPLVDGRIHQTVVVLASFNVKQHAEDQRITGWLRRVARFGVDMGAIETGSEILAAAGLLDGHEAAVHWDNLEGFCERYPDVAATSQLYTIGRGRMTCAGATTVLDMMLHWIAQHSDRTLADEVAQHLLVDRPRGPTEGQEAAGTGRDAVSNKAVSQALALMQDTIGEPLSSGEIAEHIGLSLRQLQRHFRRHLGTTVTRQYLMMRLSRAHQLLQQTDLPVTEVAVSCGFGSLENFSRVYKSTFGWPPSIDRRQSTSAPVFRRGIGARAQS